MNTSNTKQTSETELATLNQRYTKLLNERARYSYLANKLEEVSNYILERY